jgi:hypothetical protein
MGITQGLGLPRVRAPVSRETPARGAPPAPVFRGAPPTPYCGVSAAQGHVAPNEIARNWAGVWRDADKREGCSPLSPVVGQSDLLMLSVDPPTPLRS